MLRRKSANRDQTKSVLVPQQAELLHEIFENSADSWPEAIAVDFDGGNVSYSELESRANRLARYLRRRSVRRSSIVAMLLPRSIDAYASLLGILKAGAAYLPIDPEYPADRAEFILENSAAEALITTEELARHLSFRGSIIRIDTERDSIAAEDPSRISRFESGVGPRDLCYIIYTSGSTGQPKGVMVEHRSASHLVQVEGNVFAVRQDDRVYQGASLSFDLSVEEVWLAFHAGATLVAATPGMAKAGPDLSRLLRQAGVTVLSCVPTLLSIFTEDVSTVRLLILGGEPCPYQSFQSWFTPRRRIVNTYGPTETTVIATYADVSPGKRVTIGRALQGYTIHVLDEALRPVPQGDVGEICVGGVGVARGYIDLPEQTNARFVPNPFAPKEDADARLYRTGDMGRFDEEGNLEFLGRLDGQVKLRGFRVELAEIETALLQASGVAAAACTVREDLPGIQQLVGYVVPRDGAIFSEEQLRSELRLRLPAYMVPSLIESVPVLPRLPNGKLDRASLPPPRLRLVSPETIPLRPLTQSERKIARIWESLFHPQPVSVEDDFFLDLGGHSLLVARMVSEMRKDPQFAFVSVADVYDHPTIASLASAMDENHIDPQASHLRPSSAMPQAGERLGEGRRHFFAGVIQTVGLYFVFAFRGIQLVTPYLVFFFLSVSGYSLIVSAAWATVSAIAIFPVLLSLAVLAKWVVLGRVRPGRYKLWGGYYLRWWFVHSLIDSLHLDRLAGTPLLPFVYRLLGARIGKNVHLGTNHFAAFDITTIGDGSSIDDMASLLGYTVENGELVIGPVNVGRDCYVGTWSVLREYSVMEDGARLTDLSLLPRYGQIPRGETWSGSPARPASLLDPAHPPRPVHGRLHRAATSVLYALLTLLFPIGYLAAIAPGMAVLIRISLVQQPFLFLAAAPLVGASFVLLFTTEVVAIKWLLVGRVRPGTYPMHGGFYIRNWVVDQLLKDGLDVVGQLHATLYLSPWYRALGAKLGRFIELSTASSTIPDLLDIGDESTIADEASLGASRVEGGWMTVAKTRLGSRVFIGNTAVVPGGTVLGDRSLVGVLSVAPANPSESARTEASWLGSPPILLPRRQPSAAFPDAQTFRPSRKLRLARGSFEILRVTLPPAGFIMVVATVVTAALGLWARVGLVPTLLVLPVVYAAACFAVIGFVALAKWTIMGRFKPFVRPLWSTFVWRLEFVNALYEFLATPLALEPFQGTPLLPGYLRLLGVRIGSQAFIETTGFLEYDLVELGDRVALNEDCVMQTHLFEDRVLKASGLRVGSDCSVGAGSVVLYDSKMEDGSRLNALSLLMKGEMLPAATGWSGIPARRAN